jgi:hypothetical protein
MRRWVTGLVLMLAAGSAQAAHWSLTKVGEVIPTTATAPNSVGPYFPSVVDMRATPAFGHDWAMYFSTDHDGQDIYLWYADGDPFTPGNWVEHGKILDNKGETPCVVKVGSTFIMTYHRESWSGALGEQTTGYATSADGITWSEQGIALDYDPTVGLGNGHTGYFKWGANPYSQVDGTYLGYSLHGGGDTDVWSAQWVSDNGTTWTKAAMIESRTRVTPMNLPTGATITAAAARPGAIGTATNGDLVALMTVGTPASGGDPAVTDLYEAVVDGSGRRVVSVPELVLAHGGSGAIDEAEISYFCAIEYNGTIGVFYTAVNASNTNVIALATGSFDPDATAAVSLRDSAVGAAAADVHQHVDFRTVTALPDWLTTAGTAAFTISFDATNGITVPAASTKSSWLVMPTTLTASTYGYVQITVVGHRRTDQTDTSSDFGVRFTQPLGSANLDKAQVSNTGAGLGRLTIQRNGGTALTTDTAYSFGWNNAESVKKRSFGIGWWPITRRLAIIGESNTPKADRTYTSAQAPLDDPLFATVATNTNNITVEEVYVDLYRQEPELSGFLYGEEPEPEPTPTPGGGAGQAARMTFWQMLIGSE